MSRHRILEHSAESEPAEFKRIRRQFRALNALLLLASALTIFSPLLERFWNQWYSFAAVVVLGIAAYVLLRWIVKSSLRDDFEARVEDSQ